MIVDAQTELASWFMSGIPRTELKQFVLELLQNGRRGEFIVRDVGHRPDALGLLIKDTGAMEHRTFTIVQDKRKTLFRIEGAPEKFETIFMLIKFYAQRPRKSLGGIQLLLSQTSVLDSTTPHQHAVPGSIDDVLDLSDDDSSTYCDAEKTTGHRSVKSRMAMPLSVTPAHAGGLSDFDRWALNKKTEEHQASHGSGTHRGTGAASAGAENSTILRTSSPHSRSVDVAEAKRRQHERIRRLAAEKIRMATAQTESLLAAQGPVIGPPDADDGTPRMAPVDHRVDIRTVLQSNADNETKLQAQAVQVDLLRKERDLVAARLSAARATTSALRTRLGMPVAMEPPHRKIRRRPRKGSADAEEHHSQTVFLQEHRDAPASPGHWHGTTVTGVADGGSRHDGSRMPATSPHSVATKGVRFGVAEDMDAPSEGNSVLQEPPEGGSAQSVWATSKRMREKTTSPSSPSHPETSSSDAQVISAIEGLNLSPPPPGVSTQRPSAKRKRVVSFVDAHEVVQFDESDAPSTEPRREVETPTHMDDVPAGTDTFDMTESEALSPPQKGIRKRGVRTGLSAYERTRRPAERRGDAAGDGGMAIPEDDEEDDNASGFDTGTGDGQQHAHTHSRDRSRSGGSIIISGARFLAGMKASGGIRQDEVERLQHTEAVERSRREMFDYRFRSASKKVDQHADEMSLAEFHAKRFALAQQKEAEMKRRLKWDRAWDKRELKMLISRPDASDDLMTYLRDEAARETQAAQIQIRRRSQDLHPSAVHGIVSARASVFTN